VSKNIALRHCQGDWIAFQDGDDYSLCTRLERQLDGCFASGSECSYVQFVRRVACTVDIAPVSLFIRRDTFKETLGAFDAVRFGADSEIFSRIRTLGLSMHVIRECLYVCPDRWVELTDVRVDSLTGNLDNCAIREQYARAYRSFHAAYQGGEQLRYDGHRDDGVGRQYPFLVPLTKEERARFVPDSEDVRQLMLMHSAVGISDSA
jgi:hypothetical protein